MVHDLPVGVGVGVGVGYISTGTSEAIVLIVAIGDSAGDGKFDITQLEPLIAPLKESMIWMMASLQTPSIYI